MGLGRRYPIPFRGGRRFLIGALRIGHALARTLVDGHLTLQAMSLVYTTLLSLVPLLAVSFSVLKSFGVHHQALPLLVQFLSPPGHRAVEESARRIVVLVESIDVGLLGAIGVATLIYTGLSLLHKSRALRSTPSGAWKRRGGWASESRTISPSSSWGPCSLASRSRSRRTL